MTGLHGLREAYAAARTQALGTPTADAVVLHAAHAGIVVGRDDVGAWAALTGRRLAAHLPARRARRRGR